MVSTAGVQAASARVAREILVRAELGRVDEDARDDPPADPPALRHKGEMALVQRPHGRHQDDPLAGTPPIGHAPAQGDEIAETLGDRFGHGSGSAAGRRSRA
jgi:hypothetical protein